MNFLYLFLGTALWAACIMSMFAVLTLHLKVIQHTKIWKSTHTFTSKKLCLDSAVCSDGVKCQKKITRNIKYWEVCYNSALDCLCCWRIWRRHCSWAQSWHSGISLSDFWEEYRLGDRKISQWLFLPACNAWVRAIRNRIQRVAWKTHRAYEQWEGP